MDTERQAGFDEVKQDLLVGAIGQGYFVEVVFLHEFVEDIGSEHDGAGDGDDHVVEPVGEAVSFHQGVEERQTAGFPADRALSDAGKLEVFVVFLAVEFSDDATGFVDPEGGDGIEDITFGFVHVVKFRHADFPEHLCDGEERAGIEPFGEVVALHMIQQGVVGDLEDLILQRFQVCSAGDLPARTGLNENEVAKREIIVDKIPQFKGECL